MNNAITNICMVTIGVVIGSLVTYKLVDKKYESKIQEEIDLFKKDFVKRPANVFNVPDEDERPVFTEKDRDYAKQIVQRAGYTNYSQYSESDDNEEEDSASNSLYADEQSIMSEQPGDLDFPYVIAPEEFGDLENYEKISLTFFADGILASENDEEVDDVENIVGTESLEHFGEYEDDSVFVRNDRLKCDYEILKDNRRWMDVVDPPKVKPVRKTAPQKPHQMEE